MEATLSFVPERSTSALRADPLCAYSLPSPVSGQDTPRFAGDRFSPAAVHLGDNISNSSSQRSYSSDSNYFSQIHLQQGQIPNDSQVPKHRQFSPKEDSPWSGSRQPSTIVTEVSTSDVSGTHQQQQKQQQSRTASSLGQKHEVGQMSVSLNHQVSLGGQTSLGHDSLINSPAFSRSSLGHSLNDDTSQVHHQQHHNWNPSRSLFTTPAESYGSSRNTPSPTSNTHNVHNFVQQNVSVTGPQFTSTMSGNSGGLGGDGLRRSPNLQQYSQSTEQQHDQHYQQTQRQSQQFSTPQGPLASQPRTIHDNSNSGNNNNVNRDGLGTSGNSMNYRSQPSPSPGLGMNSFSSKLGGGIHHSMPSHSSFQMYNPQPMHHLGDHHQQQHQQQHHHHHGLPSPTHTGNPMRLIPPPLPSQAGMSGLVPPPLGNSGAGRGYSPYSHPGSAPPHSPGLAGPIMSPSGQMTLVSNMGMPYGGGDGNPGNGPGDGFIGGRGRPLLYSHNALHAHHLNPHQIGHHHLPGILGGKGLNGPGGAGGVHDRPFKCDVCPQSFNRNHDLKRHKRIHLAVKPFPCNYCDKSFSRKDALKVGTTIEHRI
ncbi:hypothetical protein SPBR_01429 [Sporothrix brasiliensis 5110]|uniref:C2H2-type domain-containing protein n=1 Tax=Sporothrix brasiliensis 5110 TaxID=1398154 RepID=A0A0C2IXP4_9PEZI|nr:uncharacterized protein SPBR_01429 [Sporothrix brasiliensis 5110]KIH91520.1 hypothetical protein SPBR_01429 [Sporothrix brasiliensis 5110]